MSDIITDKAVMPFVESSTLEGRSEEVSVRSNKNI